MKVTATIDTGIKLKNIDSKTQVVLGSLEASYNQIKGINERLGKIVAGEEAKIREAQENILKAKESIEENNKRLEVLGQLAVKEEI